MTARAATQKLSMQNLVRQQQHVGLDSVNDRSVVQSLLHGKPVSARGSRPPTASELPRFRNHSKVATDGLRARALIESNQRLTKENDFRKFENDKCVAENRSLREVVERLRFVEDNYQKILLEVAVLRRNMNSHTDNEVERLVDQNAHLKQEAAEMIMTNQDLVADTAEAVSRHKRKEKELKLLTDAHDKMRDKHSQLQAEHKSLRAEHTHTMNELAGASEEKQQLSAENERLAGQLADVQKKLGSLRKKYKSARQEADELGGECDRLGREHAQFSEEISQLREEIENHHATIAGLESELEREQLARADALSQVVECQQQLLNIRGNSQKRDDAMKELQENFQSIDKERRALMTDYKLTSAKLTKLESQLPALEVCLVHTARDNCFRQNLQYVHALKNTFAI